MLEATAVGIEDMIRLVLEGDHADGSVSVCYVAEVVLSPDEQRAGLEQVAPRVIGMIAGCVVVHRYSGRKMAEEIVWFVEKEHRKHAAGTQLLAALERWSGTNGASVLKMVAPAGSSVGNFLKAWGFEALEEHYIKRTV
jgi:N-acetylglutamate synthase-like GNAT family acetyltransferase